MCPAPHRMACVHRVAAARGDQARGRCAGTAGTSSGPNRCRRRGSRAGEPVSRSVLVPAWHVEPGSRLADGRFVANVHHEPVRRVVGLTLECDGTVDHEVWMAEAPLDVAWRPGDPLPRRRPGAALAGLARFVTRR